MQPKTNEIKTMWYLVKNIEKSRAQEQEEEKKRKMSSTHVLSRTTKSIIYPYLLVAFQPRSHFLSLLLIHPNHVNAKFKKLQDP